MLPQINRLTRKRDFEIVFENGRFVSGALVLAKVWQPNLEQFPKRGYKVDDLKFGFVVSKKVEKRAVWRNRVKRQMREVIRLLLKEERIESGYLVVIVAKSEIIGHEYNDIEKDLLSVLQRARVLKKKV